MDTEQDQMNVWEFLELPNDRATEAQALYSWGLNCDRDGNPFLVFLDLIGWSFENLGEPMMEKGTTLGCMELGYLADALNEYANNPNEVREWVDNLMNCEEV